MAKFEVIVGNIGTVYNGSDEKEAKTTYDTYVEKSKWKLGRASLEEVTMFKDGEPVEGFMPTAKA